MRRIKELVIICVVLFVGTYLAWAVVSSQTTKVYFTCNGSTTTFSCTSGNKIPCFASTDIKVYVRTDSTGVEEPLTLTTDYSVSALNNNYTNGFTVTTVDTYASGQTLVVKRAIALTQEVNLIRGRTIPQESLERTLDRQMLALQDSKEELGRAIRIPVTDSSYDMNLPSSVDRAHKYLAFGATGDPTVTDGTTSDIVVSSFMETVNDDATEAEARTTLGVAIGTDVQAYDADLSKVAANDYTADVNFLDLRVKSPIVDVRAYGAVDLTGIVDCTAVLQAAIDDAIAYGMVVLPLGTYKFSQLKFYNPIVFTGIGAIAGRWNDTEAGVKLLHDESQNPAILIGGTSDSDITTGNYNVAEGITLANFLLYPSGSTANVGILVDGSTSLDANRAFARDIRFENVVVRDFGSNNIKFLGGVFDIRFKGGGSFARYATGVLTATANYYSGGTTTPGQLYFYDFYSTAATGDWNFSGRGIHLYGGGCAYGNGLYALSHCQVYGTHFEGKAADPASIGIQIVGQYGIFSPGVIANHDTAIKTGDGTASVARHYSINATISGATIGLHITDGGDRRGAGIIYFASDVTTDITDDRADNDSVYNSFKLLNDTRNIKTIKTLANEATPTVGDSEISGGIFKTGGTTTITDLDNSYPGQIISILCKHSLTFDFTTAQDADHNLDGSSADITADTGDVLQFLSEDGTTLHLMFNLDASADNN